MIKIFLIFLFCAVPLIGSEQFREMSLRTKLEGLGPIDVFVGDLSEAGKKAGLETSSLKARIELKLRQNNISIQNEFTGEMKPFLILNIGFIYVERLNSFVFSSSLTLHQSVKIPRNNRFTYAQTWENAHFGITPASTARSSILDVIDTHLVFFLNDYLSANPRMEESR